MRRRLTFPMCTALLHIVFVLLFVWMYESSRDANRGLFFVIFIFLDPVVTPFFMSEQYLGYTLITNDATAFAVIFILGTAQWYFIGVMLRWIGRQVYTAYTRPRSNS